MLRVWLVSALIVAAAVAAVLVLTSEPAPRPPPRPLRFAPEPVAEWEVRRYLELWPEIDRLLREAVGEYARQRTPEFEPKLPLEVTMGDIIRLPVSFVNGTTSDLSGGSVSIEVGRGLTALGDDRWPLALGAGARGRRVVPVRIGGITGEREITLLASLGGYSDRVTRTLSVAPLGFPVELACGGVLEPDGVFSHTIEIPADVVAASVESEIVLYPTPLASLTGALERLLQEPHGCFEQTSSTTYPLIMAQQYFLSHPGVDPTLIERARGETDRRAGHRRAVGRAHHRHIDDGEIRHRGRGTGPGGHRVGAHRDRGETHRPSMAGVSSWTVTPR